MNENTETIEHFYETEKSATWGRLIYTLMLPLPTLIMFGVALFKKESLCARFTLLVMYLLESLVVMVTPVVYARAVGLAKDLPLLIVTLVYILFLYPIRILCCWTIRGYYRELRYILHNREIKEKAGDIEDQKDKKPFDDISGGKKSHQSKNSRRSKRSSQFAASIEKRREFDDESEEGVIRLNSKPNESL